MRGTYRRFPREAQVVCFAVRLVHKMKKLPDLGDAAGVGRRRGPKTLEARLEELVLAEERLAQAKKALLVEQRAESRKRLARIDALIGSVCRNDRSTHDAVKAALARGVNDPKLIAMLRAEGWV
jgi:hypothetical protein